MNYEELVKLNEMKEKGILTEEEFQREKDKVLNDDNFSTQVNNTAQTETTVDVEHKDKHKSYKKWSSIVMIILGCMLLLNYSNDSMGNPVLVFILPGLLGIIAGVLKLSSKENNNLLLSSGICSIIAMLTNTFGILDFSIYGICAVIFGILDIKYANSKK